MSFFFSKAVVIVGGLATLALSFQLGVFYGPERRDALYREYSGGGRVAAVAALRPAIARIADVAFPRAQAAGFVEAPFGPEVPGAYGRPMAAPVQLACDSAAPGLPTLAATPDAEPGATAALAIGADPDAEQHG